MIRLQKHCKAITQGEIEKSGEADHVWREQEDHCPLWDEIEIIDWEIQKLKESTYMLGHKTRLSWKVR